MEKEIQRIGGIKLVIIVTELVEHLSKTIGLKNIDSDLYNKELILNMKHQGIVVGWGDDNFIKKPIKIIKNHTGTFWNINNGAETYSRNIIDLLEAINVPFISKDETI